MKSRLAIWLGSMIVLTLLLAACASPTPADDQSQEIVEDTSGADSEAPAPSIAVEDQDASDGFVLLEDVHAADAGWVVIHLNSEGAPGPVIGYAQVEAGENHDVMVEIDLTQATTDLFAMLHLDAGVIGEYEFPGEDVPVKVGDALVNVPFSVSLPTIEPSVSVSQQDASTGSVTVDQVVAAEPGWLVIHVALNGGPGPVIGFRQVVVGVNESVSVEIDLAQATPQLFAMLHLDAGVVGEYEFPGDDAPVKVGETIVNVPFSVTLPDYLPSISVNDQETNGTVFIEEVKAAQSGWMVIHNDNEGAPGPVIGYAPVSVGLNTNLEVEIDLEQATDRIFAMLHVDAGTTGEYEFPGDDVPVRVDDAVLVVPFSITRAEAQEPARVVLTGSIFNVAELSIPVGTTVVWTQSDAVPHTVTADDGLFASGTLRNGETFEFTFTEAGTFPYYCEFHGGPGGRGMSATVIVTDN